MEIEEVGWGMGDDVMVGFEEFGPREGARAERPAGADIEGRCAAFVALVAFIEFDPGGQASNQALQTEQV